MNPDYVYIRKCFPFLEEPLVKEMAATSVVRKLSEGERLLSEGEFVKWLPIVTEGLLAVSRSEENGSELLLYYLNPGEVCSMAVSCCMSQHRSKIKAIAEIDSVVIMVPGQNIELWLSDYRTWKELIMNSFRFRFEELLLTIDALAFLKMDERIIRYLKEHKKATGESVFNGSHNDIAIHLNTSREVVSRILKSLESKGSIKLSRNMVDFTMMNI